MPKVQIRTAIATDIPHLPNIEHQSETETVWRMSWAENGAFGAYFQPVPLPRPLKLAYPRDPQRLLDEWHKLGLVLVADYDGLPIAYLSGDIQRVDGTLWLTDLVVDEAWRRKGVASALVLTAGEWGLEQGLSQMVLEASFRNHPAIALARKLGFTFSGFHYNYYPNGDAALFFTLPLT